MSGNRVAFNSQMRGNIRGIAGVLTALLVILLIREVRPASSLAPDFQCGRPGADVVISVMSGESGSDIATKLAAAGVISSEMSFFRVAVSNPKSAAIAPGNHRISRNICAVDALRQLLESSRITNLLAVNEGAWNSEIEEKLGEIGFPIREVRSQLKSIASPSGYRSLEGLLFPAQYSFDSSTAVSQVIGTMIERGLREISRAGIAVARDGFSPQELLIIASLIQAEADPIDYRKVSQVVRNRVRLGMPLQFDSTIHYVKGVRGSVFLSTESTLLNSPYNTYRNRGLPPAPINNPGALAMVAAGAPAAGDWLYFITVAPGDTRFTSSYSQFTEWKILYKKNLRQGKFK